MSVLLKKGWKKIFTHLHTTSFNTLQQKDVIGVDAGTGLSSFGVGSFGAHHLGVWFRGFPPD